MWLTENVNPEEKHQNEHILCGPHTSSLWTWLGHPLAPWFNVIFLSLSSLTCCFSLLSPLETWIFPPTTLPHISNGTYFLNAPKLIKAILGVKSFQSSWNLSNIMWFSLKQPPIISYHYLEMSRFLIWISHHLFLTNVLYDHHRNSKCT